MDRKIRRYREWMDYFSRWEGIETKDIKAVDNKDNKQEIESQISIPRLEFYKGKKIDFYI